MATGCLGDFTADGRSMPPGIVSSSNVAEFSVTAVFPWATHPAKSVLHGLGSLGRFAQPKAAIFSLCCLFVAAVSVHDAVLVVVNHELISEVEQNPVGKWLLDVQGGEVWLFVFLKFAGTALVCAVLVTIYQCSQRFGMITVIPLATFQMLLLSYLTIA
jgi:hypothetical protein